MKEYDRVVLTVDRKEYAEMGLYKGMDGWICEEVYDKFDDVIVDFDQYGPLPDIYDYAGIRKEDLRLIELSELEERAKYVGAIYFPDLVEEGYRTDGAIMLEEKEEYGKYGVHQGAYGRIVSSTDGDLVTVEFHLVEPKEIVTLTVEKKDIDYFGHASYGPHATKK